MKDIVRRFPGVLSDGFFRHSVYLDERTGCWLWRGTIDEKGYPRLMQTLAHRLIYTLFMGPIPSSMVLDHNCRQRACVNPFHLEPLTQKDNMARLPWTGQVYRPTGRNRLYLKAKVNGAWRSIATRFKPGQEAEAEAMLEGLRQACARSSSNLGTRRRLENPPKPGQ